MKEEGLLIHFKNKSFKAEIGWSNGKMIELTPVVCDEQPFGNCGIGLMHHEIVLQMWGLGGPRDLITSWRATEIVRHFTVIDNYTLSKTFYAGRRYKQWNNEEKKKYLDPVIVIIGQELYDKIMSMPIPEKIIRAILDNQDLDYCPDTFPIEDEIKAGTVKWRQEFTIVDIKNPKKSTFFRLFK